MTLKWKQADGALDRAMIVVHTNDSSRVNRDASGADLERRAVDGWLPPADSGADSNDARNQIPLELFW
jgi:hypothetical protein